jgi:hypothetical protein
MNYMYEPDIIQAKIYSSCSTILKRHFLPIEISHVDLMNVYIPNVTLTLVTNLRQFLGGLYERDVFILLDEQLELVQNKAVEASFHPAYYKDWQVYDKLYRVIEEAIKWLKKLSECKSFYEILEIHEQCRFSISSEEYRKNKSECERFYRAKENSLSIDEKVYCLNSKLTEQAISFLHKQFIENELIEPNTPFKHFLQAFSPVNKKLDSPINWIASQRLLVYFFDKMLDNGDFVSIQYQHIIAQYNLFTIKGKTKTASNLSSALNDMKTQKARPRKAEIIDKIIENLSQYVKARET